MAHPFVKIFENALRKSTADDNHVLIEAEKLREKGYSVTEISGVLIRLEKSLIDDSDASVLSEASLEFSRHLP